MNPEKPGISAGPIKAARPLTFNVTTLFRNHFQSAAKSSGNKLGSSLALVDQRGSSQMITAKLIALLLGAGVLVSVFSADFTPDFVLAIVACFS
jgi:hypothetical protein